MEADKGPQGKVLGIIVPPPEIRAVVDKTAHFVAKNGKSFEQRILSSSEGKTAKFNFMKEFDPYHAYYELKIREIEEAIVLGKDVAAVINKPPPAPATAPQNVAPAPAPTPTAPKVQEKKIVASSAKAALSNPIAKLANIPPKIAPYNLEFTLAHPAGVSVADIDVIKLTAQYTAVNGREFLAALATREQRNPQFDFLKPTHMLFSYFTTLVDAYAKIVHPSEELKQRIDERTKLQHVYEYAVHRWNWRHSEDERKRQQQSIEDADRLAAQAIDWYDFTVVEVIEFGENELLDIPGLANLDLNANGRAGTVPSSSGSSGGPPPPPPLMGMAPPPRPPAGNGAVPPPPPPSMPAPPPPRPPVQFMDDDDDDEKIKVVTNYKPRLAGSAQHGSSSNGMMTIDPVTGKPVPLDQLEEHMRIQLLDPKWKEDQKRFQEKQKDTGFAEGASIADSLKIFAQKRGDIFGQTVAGGGGNGESSAASIAEQEAREAFRHQQASQVQWDGHLTSMATVQQMKSMMPGMPDMPMPMSNIGPAPAPPSLNVPPPPPMHMYNAGMAPPPPPLPMAPPQPYGGQAPPPPPPLPMAPMMPGFPPMPPNVPRPPTAPIPTTAEDDQKNKKPRIEDNLIPADAFAAMHPNPINIIINVPNDPTASNWNFNGQTITVSVSVTASVKDLKESLGVEYLGNMPANKMQLKTNAHGFLKDATLAALNIGPGTVIDVSSKSRGGKR